MLRNWKLLILCSAWMDAEKMCNNNMDDTLIHDPHGPFTIRQFFGWNSGLTLNYQKARF